MEKTARVTEGKQAPTFKTLSMTADRQNRNGTWLGSIFVSGFLLMSEGLDNDLLEDRNWVPAFAATGGLGLGFGRQKEPMRVVWGWN